MLEVPESSVVEGCVCGVEKIWSEIYEGVEGAVAGPGGEGLKLVRFQPDANSLTPQTLRPGQPAIHCSRTSKKAHP